MNKSIIYEIENGKKINHYKKTKHLGKGTFANVYEVMDQDNNIFAIKIVSKIFLKRNKVKPQFLKEIKIHSELENENIIKLHKVFEDNYFIYLLLDLCNDKNLSDLIIKRGKLTELEAAFFAKQLINGLKYLKEKNIIHRDIKPSNLLFDENMNLKIADFGLATYFDKKRPNKSFCGTPNFLAPEIFNTKEGYGHEVDIWSFGVNLYCMLFGKAPFEKKTIKESYQAILTENYDLNLNDIKLSEECLDLIQFCLKKNLNQRFTLENILEHKFLNNKNLPKKISNSIFNNSYTIPEKWDSNKEINNYLNMDILYKNSIKEIDIEHAMTIRLNKNVDDFKKQKSLTSKHIYVKKWADMSDKFGIGYILNSGAIGIFFKDGTKLYLSPYGITYNYEEKDIKKVFTLVNSPEDLKKKIDILNLFKENLEKILDKKLITNKKNKTQKFYNENITVIKYKKTNNAWIFKLSSGYIQTIFEDKTELHLNKYDGNFIYIDQMRNKNYYHLKEDNWKDKQYIINRLKYIQKSIN